MKIMKYFPNGVLRPELLMGEVTSINSNSLQLNLSEALRPSGSHYMGGRYGKGEVGEFVIIEGQINLVLGRLIEIRQQENDVSASCAVGKVQLLGSIDMETLEVTPGVEKYPRLEDRVFAAPHKFISLIPQLMDIESDNSVTISIGTVDVAQEAIIQIKPEKLFGRHLAILGSTGGGKSWTTTKILEECLKFNSKIILIDATGEYRNLNSVDIDHLHLSKPVTIAPNSKLCSLPPTSFQESDFISLFEPSGKVQGPKFREAIKSLRIAYLCPDLFPEGYVKKINNSKTNYNKALELPSVINAIDNPETSFNVTKLIKQIEQECVYPDGGYLSNPDTSKWGKEDGNFSHCLSLITRMNGIFSSPSFECVFKDNTSPSLIEEMKRFFVDDKKLLRIDLSGIPFEYNAREIISNVIGRFLLKEARKNNFQKKPLIVFLDEAHNFLGKNIGSEDSSLKLDSFELIAKEGRKFGLNICLATQRPRDITDGVLSQIGTLIVHRLTNDRDREVVEKACGEIDKAASSFLPNLKPGEAAIIGNDFPIPLTIQITPPAQPPQSSGPNYQKSWSEK